MGEEGRVGVFMCAGCAFVCVLLYVMVALTQVAMQDRRLVACADSLASVGADGASGSILVSGAGLGVDEAGVRSRVEEALGVLESSTCRVGEGVSVVRVGVVGGDVEVVVRARPRVSVVPPGVRTVVLREFERTSSARVRRARGGV